MLKRPLLITLLLSIAHSALAHDPGLSRTEVQLSKEGITIHMVLDRKDVEHLAPAQPDHAGSPAEPDWSRVRARLRSHIPALVEVRNAGTRVQPKSVKVELTPSHAVNIDAFYRPSAASTIQLHIPLLARLADGHRQYLTMRDANANLLAQHVLDAGSPPISLQVPGR